MIVGFFGWVVAMVAAAYALRRVGATWPLTLLVGGATLFAVHPPPVGPIGLVCLSGAVVLVERWRTREAPAAAKATPAPLVEAAS
jgi:drug/metabolite transporter (DMT)-like permease